MDRRKSRSSSFSILSRFVLSLVLRQCFCRFTPSCLGKNWLLQPALNGISADSIFSAQSTLAFSCAIRATTSFRIPSGYFFIPFFPDILRPPNVVLFSYIRGLLSIVRFYWSGSMPVRFLCKHFLKPTPPMFTDITRCVKIK